MAGAKRRVDGGARGLLRGEGIGHVRARGHERAKLVRVRRAPLGLALGVLLLANLRQRVDQPTVEAVACEPGVVMAGARLEVGVPGPEPGDMVQGKGVPAETVREGLVRVGRRAELLELLVEGVEVVVVVFV